MTIRDGSIQRLHNEPLDVLIIGAGINGAVSAASLATKGAKVGLIDRGDFAGQTSSQSSNLAWGGIKYLENNDYLLVNKLCKSRNHLMQSYPSTVKEIRFLTSVTKGFRFPAFLVFLGTVLYWMLGRFVTKPPTYKTPKLLKHMAKIINTDQVVGGFEYSDCYLHDNDSRFVFNFIKTSIDAGCASANYVESLGSSFIDGLWHTKLHDLVSGDVFSVTSKVLINACGPFVDAHNKLVQQTTKHQHLFSKGIHLIVERISDVDKVLTFFASDGRLFFVMPMGPKTCIGTTDNEVDTPYTTVTDEDRAFVLDNVNNLLALDKPLTPADIISERCGVRPLAVKSENGVANWVKLSRKHAIETNKTDNHLSIFGGKLTDCVNVGDEVAASVKGLGVKLKHYSAKWYGEPDRIVHQKFLTHARQIKLDDMTPSSSTELLSERLWRRYGNDAFSMLEKINKDAKQAELLIENTEYLRCEIEHAASHEMIVTLEDFLRRRSKVSLVVRDENLRNNAGLVEACEILFGDDAPSKMEAYFEQ